MSRIWFKPLRKSYIPVSWPGVVLYAVFLAFVAATAFVGWNIGGNIVYNAVSVLCQWVLGAVVLTWVASKSAKKSRKWPFTGK